MTAIGPTLTTERLILRPPAAQDFSSWAAFMSTPETAQFVGGVQPRTAVWRSFAAVTGAWIINGFSMFSVIEKESGAWVGRLGPWQPEGWPGTEVGWGIAREHWGKGYATEGSIAAINWAFDVLGWNEVIHCIDPKNTPSQKVAQRLGSTLRGPTKLPPPFEDANVELWGQTRAQWRARWS